VPSRLGAGPSLALPGAADARAMEFDLEVPKVLQKGRHFFGAPMRGLTLDSTGRGIYSGCSPRAPVSLTWLPASAAP